MIIDIYVFKLKASKKLPPKQEEFEGLEITAPNQQEAINVFSGIDGKWGCVNLELFDIIQSYKLYEYNGSIDEWMESEKLGENPEI